MISGKCCCQSRVPSHPRAARSGESSSRSKHTSNFGSSRESPSSFQDSACERPLRHLSVRHGRETDPAGPRPRFLFAVQTISRKCSFRGASRFSPNLAESFKKVPREAAKPVRHTGRLCVHTHARTSASFVLDRHQLRSLTRSRAVGWTLRAESRIVGTTASTSYLRHSSPQPTPQTSPQPNSSYVSLRTSSLLESLHSFIHSSFTQSTKRCIRCQAGTRGKKAWGADSVARTAWATV